jgi:type IV secretory pathway VirB9-like protein
MRNLALVTLVLLPCVAHAAQSVREVTVQPRTVVTVHARVRYTTMIVLPEGEQILDFVCGDKDFWVISGANNLAYVKPAKSGASTNLNLVTASGRVYSFLLTEGGADLDLNLYVVNDVSGRPPSPEAVRFVPATHVEDLRRELARVRVESDAARDAASAAMQRAVDDFRATYPTRLRFPYRFESGQKPFHVSAIFHDGTFTYLRTAARELPALYELRDGRPNLVNFQVHEGLYIVPKVLDRGYLAIGKKRFVFQTVDR